MKFSVFLFALSLLGLTLFNSCKQCYKGNGQQTSNHDTVAIPLIDQVSAAIKLDSLNPVLYYKRARIYEMNGSLKDAKQDMFKALTLDSIRPEYLLFAADIFKKTGEIPAGIALMDKAIASDSLNSAYYVKAAELAYVDTAIKANYKIALLYLQAALEKDPQNADIYFYKGNAFKAMGDTLKALSAFQTATEVNPKYYDAYVQIGLLLDKRKDKKATAYLDNAIKVGDKPEDALYAKANIYKQEALAFQDANQMPKAIEKFGLAIENFKRVIEVNHRNVEAYMGIGFSYYQMDSVKDAYKYYQLATQIDPQYAGAYFSQGLCAEDLDRRNEAIILYENCLNIDPNFKRAEQHLKKLQGIPN